MENMKSQKGCMYRSVTHMASASSSAHLWCMGWQPVVHGVAACGAWGGSLWCMGWQAVVHGVAACGAWGGRLWCMGWQAVVHGVAGWVPVQGCSCAPARLHPDDDERAHVQASDDDHCFSDGREPIVVLGTLL